MTCLMNELARTDCALLLVTHDRDLAEAATEHRLDLDAHRPATQSGRPATASVSSTK